MNYKGKFFTATIIVLAVLTLITGYYALKLKTEYDNMNNRIEKVGLGIQGSVFGFPSMNTNEESKI